MLNFLNGLDNVHSLQRLYAVSSVTLSGGGTTSPTYSLQLSGDIFYSSGQEDVCSSSKTMRVRLPPERQSCSDWFAGASSTPSCLTAGNQLLESRGHLLLKDGENTLSRINPSR